MMPRAVAAMLGAEVVLLAAIGLVALDMRAHKRVEALGGVNVWGYRGAVLHDKQPNEIRIAVVGGDLAFGWGVAADETLTAYLRRRVILDLDRAGGANRVVTAVNLGAQGLALSEYETWLQHFAYLEPDVICLLPDPGRHVLRNGRFLPDRQSVAFSAFGYSPILPLVLQERGAISHSSVMRAAGGLLARADLLESFHAPARPDVRQATRSAIAAATKLAAMGVVVVMPPDGDADIRGALGADTDVPVVDLGDVPILRSDELRLDRFHLSAGGHSRAADAVAPAVLQLVHAAEPGRR
jgi:hypothetical protein